MTPWSAGGPDRGAAAGTATAPAARCWLASAVRVARRRDSAQYASRAGWMIRRYLTGTERACLASRALPPRARPHPGAIPGQITPGPALLPRDDPAALSGIPA